MNNPLSSPLSSAPNSSGGPLIIEALIGPADFAQLDRLRRDHYPPERNQLPAHLTLFHGLAPSAAAEAGRLLGRLAAEPPPAAMIAGPVSLGTGTALRIVSQPLELLRERIADHFHGALSSQDAVGWRPHVTIQNKVSATDAGKLLRQLEAEYWPRPLAITGLALNRYDAGQWRRISAHPFRGRPAR